MVRRVASNGYVRSKLRVSNSGISDGARLKVRISGTRTATTVNRCHQAIKPPYFNHAQALGSKMHQLSTVSCLAGTWYGAEAVEPEAEMPLKSRN